MRVKLAVALSLLAARPPSGLEVTSRDGRVVVRASAAPLADVLTRFAQATGAEVVYEAPRPRQPVTVVIEADSPAAALTQLLEGQGLNYVLRLDPTRKKVEMLLVVGGSSPTPASAGTARGPRASPPPFPPPEEEEREEPEFESPFAPEEIVPPGQEPSSPEMPPGSGAPQPEQPEPPGAASYPGGIPTNPPAPQPPVPPGPASYPP